jgi:ribosomal protein S18 acetylase RimI-like enzyme
VTRTQISPGTRHPSAAQAASGPQDGPQDGLQIRAAVAADCEAISSFVTGLSLRTRFLRFFAPASPPSPAVLRGMCGAADGSDVLVATDGGEIVGHVMAVDVAGPDGSRAADIGLVVADRWQGRGVGSHLLRDVTERAVARGVSTLLMDVLPENRRMLAMISRQWAGAAYEFRPDAVQVRVPLPGAPKRAEPRHTGQEGRCHGPACRAA